MNQDMSFSSSGHSYVGAQPPWEGVRPPVGSQTSGSRNSYGKPPSWRAVRPLVGSETTGNQVSYGQPPSLNDVRGPHASQTSSSFNQNQISDAESNPGMGLTTSRVDVRPLVGSETTGNQDSYGKPPSINDLPVPQASHTSSSSKRKEISVAETQSGMSLTLSRVDVRPLVGTGGTRNQDSYGKPLSNDVPVPQASHTSSSAKRKKISGAESQSGMCLTPSRVDVRLPVGSQTSGNRNSYGKPLSSGAVRTLVGSQTTGGTGNQDFYDQSPPLNDIRGPQAVADPEFYSNGFLLGTTNVGCIHPLPQPSQTSSLFIRNEISGAELQSDMSLTSHDFMMEECGEQTEAVRPPVGSQTTGGTSNQDSYGQPPSLNDPNDVRGPHASPTSSLFIRNEISGAESKSDMNLTPHDIMMVDSGEEGVVDRLSCLVWTPDLHKQFVEAVRHLDTMLQVVNVEELTLEDVSSNLQRCKLSL